MRKQKYTVTEKVGTYGTRWDQGYLPTFANRQHVDPLKDLRHILLKKWQRPEAR